MRKTKLLSVFLTGLLIYGCDFDSIELDKVIGPTVENVFAVNIGNIKYTVDELVRDIEDETLEVVEGNDLSMAFVYRDTSIFNDIDAFIKLSDITNTDTYSPFDIDIPSSGSLNVISVPTETFEFEFNPDDGEQVDSTFFRGGTLQYTLTSDFGVEIDYVFTLNDIQTLEGEPIVFSRTLPAGSPTDSQSRPLAGLKNISKRVGSSNIFNVSLDLTFNIPAGTPISAGDQIMIELEFIDSEFSAIFGDFGTDPVDIQKDTIFISAFDEFNEGGLTFNNPSITMNFDNNFGVELGVELAEVTAVDSDNSETKLTGSVVDVPQFVDAPNESQLGSSVVSSFSIDNTNSNIDDLLNTTPSQFVFDVTAIPNFTGSDNIVNFLFDSSYLEIISTIEIPLDFRMDGFSKDIDLDVSGSDFEDADSLKINVEVVNEIPFDGLLDLSFQDGNGTVLYTLDAIGLIESPQIGIDGRTLDAATSNSSIVLNDEALDAFLQSNAVFATINIFTLGNESSDFVKIFSDYKLEIFLTAEGKVSVDL